MTPETSALISTALHWGVGALLALATGFFLTQFLGPGWRVGRELREARERLEKLKASGALLSLDQVRSEAMVSEALQHCWDEYRDTLHGQKQANAMGVMEVRRWRATSMAGAFFTDQALVEAPLRTEFYKHLPGILTGVGIIGTFLGLIVGLQAFKVSDDATVVRGSLEALLASVGGAFQVSAGAIFLAMLVTTIEKAIINGRYTELERLCSLIDSLFDAGAGEEYLQRLVEASETSATQAMQMKESLVTDLKQVLSELTQQQIATMTATSQQLGQSISQSLTEGLTDPLARISQAVQQVGNSQGEAVNKLLTDVLGNFTQQMQSMFGSQMSGMNDMLVQTANTIKAASEQFEQLAGQIQQAGSGAADAMAKRIDESLQEMHARQTEANEHMRSFIDQLKESVSRGQAESAELNMSMMQELGASAKALVQGLQSQVEATQATGRAQQEATTERLNQFLQSMQANAAQSQSESAAVTQRMMGQLNESTTGAVRELQAQAQSAAQANEQRQAEWSAATRAAIEAQSEQISRLAGAVQQASAAMEGSVDRLQSRAQACIEGMGQGAEKLDSAAQRLGQNLDLMRANSDRLNDMSDKLTGSAATLGSVLSATQQVLNDQHNVRDAFAALVQDLRETVSLAKREASMSASLVDSLQAASQRLTEAQRTTETYLQGVSNVLGEAHGAFSQQVMATLRDGNKAFHEELAHATGLLRGAIRDLGDVLDNLPSAA
jgi:hypothetical protein